MKNESPSKTLQVINILFLILLTIAFIYLAFCLSTSKNAFRDLDFFTFWLGGKLTSLGKDVYAQETWVGAHPLFGSSWIPNLYFVYPLTTAALFVPLGMLPIESASFVWLVFSFLCILASLLLLLHLWHTPTWTRYILPFTLGLLLFRPVILIFLMGQIDGLLLLILALSLFFLASGKPLPAHLLLGFLLLKPNIGVPVLCGYGAWLLWKKQWKNLVVLGGSSLFLLLLPLLIDIQWIGKYLNVGFYKSQNENLYPTLRGLAGLITDNRTPATDFLWIASSIILVGAAIGLVLKNRKAFEAREILSLSICLTLLITPYLRSYDLILLLIPILFSTQVKLSQRGSFLKTNLFFLGWGLLSFALLFLADYLKHDIWSIIFTAAVSIGYTKSVIRTARNPSPQPEG